MEKIEEASRQKVLLIGVDTGKEPDFEGSMRELGSLAEACMMEVVGVITQKMESINKALYLGSGKVAEAREFGAMMEAQAAVFDNALSPSQMRNLQKELDMPVLDRTSLILDIFSKRARTREAKLQVETARLQYMLPRLVGLHEALGRQGGASGSLSNKGAGEKKLELDRRKIEHRISELKKELEEVSGERQTQRKKRMGSEIPRVSLVGYTNAGKSTIMNQMVDRYVKDESKKVLEKDMLFATLETSVRLIDAGENRPFFLADTVGFIHKLPHDLIKAFRSTLEEVREADLLLHVVDCSDPAFRQHMKVTEDTLRDLGAGGIPVIHVYNKADLCVDDRGERRFASESLPVVMEDRIYLCAREAMGIQGLTEQIMALLYAGNSTEKFFIPYDKGNVLSYLLENGSPISQEYVENGIRLEINVRQKDRDKYKMYLVEDFQ